MLHRSRKPMAWAPLLVLLIAACEGTAPSTDVALRERAGLTEPTAPISNSEQEDDEDDDAPRLLRCAPLAADSGQALIGAAGGTLVIGPHRFVVPAGALDSAVMITARIAPDSLVAVKFGPSGLQFKEKARLELATTHCAQFPSTSLLVAHIADDASAVVESLSTNQMTGGVWAEIEHFTRYAISF